jgi:hypothetical protein
MDQPPRDLTGEAREILAGLSKLVIDELELRLEISELDDEAERLRLAEKTTRQALARFEKAEHDLISEHVARELGNMGREVVFRELRLRRLGRGLHRQSMGAPNELGCAGPLSARGAGGGLYAVCSLDVITTVADGAISV